MEQCKCPNCGAAINVARRICEYCGTTFKLDDLLSGPTEPLKIVVQRPGVKVLGAVMQMDRYEMTMLQEGGDLDRYVRGRLAHIMAEKLMENMNIEYRHNPYLDSAEYRARLRVLDPAFKF